MVWPTHGCLCYDFQSVSSSVRTTHEMRTKAKIGILHVPYALGSGMEYDNFMALPSVGEMLAQAQAGQVIVGRITTADVMDEVTPPTISKQAFAVHAQSRFLGNYLDTNGAWVTPDAQALICLSTAEVQARKDKKNARIFGLAVGADLQPAVQSALRANLISDLIMDELLAAALLSSPIEPCSGE